MNKCLLGGAMDMIVMMKEIGEMKQWYITMHINQIKHLFQLIKNILKV